MGEIFQEIKRQKNKLRAHSNQLLFLIDNSYKVDTETNTK